VQHHDGRRYVCASPRTHGAVFVRDLMQEIFI
jgi:hypothetical protein